jgi:hypothetical protein
VTDVEAVDAPEALSAGTYIPPIWLQSLTYPAASDRLLADTLYTTGGVVGAGAMVVAPRAAGANMSVDVAAGTVVVAGTSVAGQGKYVGRLTAPVNVPISAAPGAGLVRIDVICAKIYDATAAGGTRNELTVEEPLVGTAVASNPVAPALPVSSEALAQITVAAGTASITAGLISDRRRQATLGLASTANYVAAGVIYPNTDANGHILIALPAGGKLVNAVAVGVTGTGPFFFALDPSAAPLGGPNAVFSVYNQNGALLTSSGVIGVSYQIVYTF